MVEIIPAILTDNSAEALELVDKADGVIERVQIDIIDGEFANNKTVEPKVFEGLETRLKFDYHLMVQEPVNWVKRVTRAGGDRIIGHIEMMSSQERFVTDVQKRGVVAGLAIDLETPVGKIDERVLGRIGVIIVLSVKAGFGGQKFDKSALDKIYELDQIRKRKALDFKICDDGGVTLSHIQDVARQGVDEVSIGRRIFKGDLSENIKKYQMAAYE